MPFSYVVISYQSDTGMTVLLQGVLTLAHEILMAGHLGINKRYRINHMYKKCQAFLPYMSDD